MRRNRSRFRAPLAYALAAVAGALLLGSSGRSEDRGRLYTSANPPAADALDRLNLKQAWAAYVPLEGRRDGIATVQSLGTQIVVQTRSGLVAAYDSETGDSLWKTRVGKPYRDVQAIGFNKRDLFVVENQSVYAIERTTGRQRWAISLEYPTTSAAAANDVELVVTMTKGRVANYQLYTPADRAAAPRAPAAPGTRPAPVVTPGPPPGARPAPASAAAAAASGTSGLAEQGDIAVADEPPPLVWEYSVVGRIEQPALLAGTMVLLLPAEGQVVALPADRPEPLYRLVTEGAVTVPAGQEGDVAYFGSEDESVYALEISTGKVVWRFAANSRVLLRPEVTDEYVYVVTSRGEMVALKRTTGQVAWRNTAARRFLASGPNLVYASDSAGRMLVLDRARGTVLGTLDTRDFVVPVANDRTDRIYLAANNGLLLALRDRNARTPVQMKRFGNAATEVLPKDPKAKSAVEKADDKTKPAEPGSGEKEPGREDKDAAGDKKPAPGDK